MSIYIHIPFCNSICTYCDFCKVFKNHQWIKQYLKALNDEIKTNYRGEKIKTIYIGGGTPSSLSIDELQTLFDIINQFNLENNPEITFEANSEDLTTSKINFLKNKITRLSIGVQTFNPKYLKQINRTINYQNLQNAIKTFENTNIDLMYGFQNQTINELKKDLNQIIKLNPKHISTYCLIIEPNTKLYIDHYQPLNDDQEYICYQLIRKTLKENNYNQYELSNFSKKGYESKHNLTYWNNQQYYGFGLGASGYINNVRYENTKSLTNYLHGNYRLNQHQLSLDETIQNEFIIGLRKIKGLNKQSFYNKYQIHLNQINIVKQLLEKKLLKENKTNIYINPKYLYTSNEILLNFIDFSLHKH